MSSVRARDDPICKTFGQRLKEEGKRFFVIIGVIMPKLLHVIFGILRSGKPFNSRQLRSPETA